MGEVPPARRDPVVAAAGAGARGRRRAQVAWPRASSRPSATSRASRTCAARSRRPSAAARPPTPSAPSSARAPSAWPAQLERAEARAAAAEAHLAERRQQAEEAAGPRGEASDEWLAAHEALLDELDTVRAHREELLRQVEELREAAAQDAKAIARLSATLGEAAAGPERRRRRPPSRRRRPPPWPRRSSAPPRRPATSSSRAPPTRRRPTAPTGARPTCWTRSCASTSSPALYADPDGFGRSLSQAADELGLTWRQNVSELARSRKPHAYSITHDGERLELGPHVAIGSGSGAGFIARIYLHVADGSGEVPRGLYVGHVGRHLPDTTTA